MRPESVGDDRRGSIPASAAVDLCPSCGQPHTDDEVCRPEGAPALAATVQGRCLSCDGSAAWCEYLAHMGERCCERCCHEGDPS